MLTIMMLYIWRHPKPLNVQGLCYGQTDVKVHPRKVKRLASQIDSYVKKNNLPKKIWVSPLQRSRLIGEVLTERGFECQVDPRLCESHFGTWENRQWADIAKSDIDAWCANFATFAPSGGENLNQLFERVEGWLVERIMQVGGGALDENKTVIKPLPAASDSPPIAHPVLVVGHAGWITAATYIQSGKNVPHDARDWPIPIAYGERQILDFHRPY